jgi:hypothetical protein
MGQTLDTVLYLCAEPAVVPITCCYRQPGSNRPRASLICVRAGRAAHCWDASHKPRLPVAPLIRPHQRVLVFAAANSLLDNYYFADIILRSGLGTSGLPNGLCRRRHADPSPGRFGWATEMLSGHRSLSDRDAKAGAGLYARLPA